jgi:hypothetical protein
MKLKEAWRSVGAPLEDESPVETLARILTSGPRCLSLYTHIPELRDVYILAWLPVLVFLALITGYSGTLGIIASSLAFVLAAYRFIDIYSAQLGILFVDIKRPGYFLRSVQRSVALDLVDIFEVALIFSIFTHCLSLVQTKPYPFGSALTRVDYFYVSWTNMLALGSKYPPVTQLAEVLVMLEVAAGLGLVVLIIAVYVSGLRLPVGRTAGRGATGPTAEAASASPSAPNDTNSFDGT